MRVKFEKNQAEVNRNAATLVVICINKLYEVLIGLMEGEFNSKSTLQRGISIRMLKRIYSTCAKLYITDFLLYIAMKSPKDDIFYIPPSNVNWETLGRHYYKHEFPNPRKIINAYQNFFALVAISNAMINKSANSKGIVSKYVSKGYYATYYLFSAK